MLSPISLARLQEGHPILYRRIIKMDALAPDINFQVSRCFATAAQQAALYAEGRTTPGPLCEHNGVTRPIGTCPEHPWGLTVTNANVGQSAHEYGYAADLFPEDIVTGQPDWNVNRPAWQKMLAVGLSCGLAEGATWRTFKDNPHFYLQELPANPTTQMRQLLAAQGVQALWNSWSGILATS